MFCLRASSSSSHDDRVLRRFATISAINYKYLIKAPYRHSPPLVYSIGPVSTSTSSSPMTQLCLEWEELRLGDRERELLKAIRAI